MNSQEFSDLLLKNFKFKPTSDQKEAIIKLSEFLSNNNNVSLFLLKGYAGTGKTSLMKTLVENIHLPKKKILLLRKVIYFLMAYFETMVMLQPETILASLAL